MTNGDTTPNEPVFSREYGVDFSPWSNSTNGFRGTVEDETISFALIKPGFEMHVEQILEIIRNNDLEIVYQDTLCLTPEIVDVLYADSVHEHFYETMREHLCEHPVTVVMVASRDDDAQEIIYGLKKNKSGGDGIIRELFKHVNMLPEEDFVLWQAESHPRQRELTILLSQGNVIHTADTTTEALEDLAAIFGEKFRELRIRGSLPSELWDILPTKNSEEEQ
jgi:nucleoside diphosphate kinase